MNKLNKKTMTLEQEFKEKVGFDAYENNQMQPKAYNESYVEWLEAKINYTRCCTELPNKALKDSQLSDMVAGYKMMCRPDANFEKYYSKGFTECWEWLKRITK